MTTLFRFRYTAAFVLLIGVGSARSLAVDELAGPTGPLFLSDKGDFTSPSAGEA